MIEYDDKMMTIIYNRGYDDNDLIEDTMMMI